MKTLNKINSLLFLLCVSLSFAQQTPAPKQSKTIAIVGATAHIGNGTVIDNSIIIMEDGKIKNVSDATVSKIEHKRHGSYKCKWQTCLSWFYSF